jgi:hypothetical protein
MKKEGRTFECSKVRPSFLFEKVNMREKKGNYHRIPFTYLEVRPSNKRPDLVQDFCY